MCRSNSPSFSLGLAVGGRVRLSPFAARPLAADEPHVRRHSCFSPAVYGTRAGHLSAQHFSLRHPEQGRRGLSFTVEGAAASRPSRHPISGMSSLARHSDPSVILPSRMGAFTRGIAVGSPHNPNRLHSSVWGKYPPFRRVSPDSSKQRRQGFCSTTGTFLPPTERSNRGSTAVGSRTRFLQPLLPRSKEGRRLEAYPGSTAFESFPLQREVQNADDENHHVSGPGGRLVCHHRPEGCVFSHPGRSQTQEIPSVRLWREGLPIQGSALRPGFGPEDIYQMHGCCTGPFEAPGHSCTELSGRLAHSGSLQGASESSQGYRSRPHPFSWPQDERQEECAPPISTNCVSRSSFGFRSDAGPFGSCPDTSFYSMFGPLQARPSCLCRYLPQAVGPYGSSLPCVAPRAASHEAIPLVDEGAEVTPHCTSYSPCQSVAQLLSTPVNDSRHRCVRPPMAECQSVRVSANKADSGSTMQSEGERCPSPSHSPILALPDLVLGANSPLVSTSLGDSDQTGLTVPASGQDLASSAGALEVVGMAHTGPRAVIDGLPAGVQETIASARAPATRKLYSSKWGVFESWCLTRAIDPVKCPVGPVLEFLQERLTAGAAATTLRVYVAAIAAQRELDEIPLGRHRLVSAFMRGARRLRPVRPTAVPSWDLSVVLEGLVMAPFEPLESASDRILTLKVVLLLALTSLKRVGDLQAFSVSETCMPRVYSKLPCGLGRVTFPRSCPRRSFLKWSLFTLSIPLPLLQVRMRDSTCSARSGHWSCMWIAPRFGENLPSYWSVLVLVAAGLPRQSRGFLTGWETPFRWLMRRGNSLHLLVFGRILLEA